MAKKVFTNAERQKIYYHKHKAEKKQAREILGVSSYTDAHKRYYLKKKVKDELL